jgi:hypothetical protein
MIVPQAQLIVGPHLLRLTQTLSIIKKFCTVLPSNIKCTEEFSQKIYKQDENTYLYNGLHQQYEKFEVFCS